MTTPAAEPDVGHDRLIGFIQTINREDQERAETAAETREAIAAFIEDTAFNAKALSILRALMKLSGKANGTQRAMDVIRSLHLGLPMVEAHILGQQPVLNFGDDAVEPYVPDVAPFDGDAA